MNRKTIIALLVSLVAITGLANAQYDLEMDIEFPHSQTNVIMTNYSGTGDEFTVKARVLYNGSPVNYPDDLFLKFEWINDYFRSCLLAEGPTLDPTSGPDANGYYYWEDIRLPAGGVERQMHHPGNYPVLYIKARDSWWYGQIHDGQVAPIEISAPGLTGFDGVVNLSDYITFTQILNGNYLSCADLNGDGVIDLSDTVRFTYAIGTSCPDVKGNKRMEPATEIDSWGGVKSMYR